MAINTVSGQVEHDSARPVLTRAHGVFSLAVVAASLTGGLVLSGAAGTGGDPSGTSGLRWALAVAAGAVLLLCALVWAGTRFHPIRSSPRVVDRTTTTRGSTTPAPGLVITPLVVVGLVGALAYATENAHQSWGAVFLTDTFAASPQTAALAPAAFAAAAATARLISAPLSRTHPVPLLITGGVLAAIGSVIVATSTSVVVALLGFGVAAVGTATSFPTLLSISLRDVPARERGRATSAVSTTAYLGFLLGPAYLGLLADHVGLRGAVIGVAVLAVVFAIAAGPVSRRTAGRAVVKAVRSTTGICSR